MKFLGLLVGAAFRNEIVKKIAILYHPLGNQPGRGNPPADQHTADSGLIGLV